MNPHRFSATVGLGIGIGTAVAMAAAAVAWRDCMLLAGSSVLAFRVFLVRMDRGTPWRRLSVAVNCLTAGVLVGAAGVALVAGVGAAWLGWWHPAAAPPALALLLLAAGAVWCCLSRDGREGATEELRLWVLMLVGVVAAMLARGSGVALAPCIFAASVGLTMLWVGWHFAGATTSSLLRAGSESG